MLQADMFSNYGRFRRCACCKKLKEVFEFNRLGDGYQSYCKDCQRAYKSKHPTSEHKKNKKDDYSLNLF